MSQTIESYMLSPGFGAAVPNMALNCAAALVMNRRIEFAPHRGRRDCYGYCYHLGSSDADRNVVHRGGLSFAGFGLFKAVYTPVLAFSATRRVVLRRLLADADA